MGFFECHGLRSTRGLTWPDLSLGAGEVRVVRGPNGCGKTLWLRALADLDPVAAGSIRLQGQDSKVVEGPSWRALVRYLHPNAPRLPGSAAEAWELLGGGDQALPGELDPGTEHRSLSSGQAQILALRAALLGPAKVLLVDEATAALDPDRARSAEAAVLDFAQADRAVLWVSHDEGLAARLGAQELLLP